MKHILHFLVCLLFLSIGLHPAAFAQEDLLKVLRSDSTEHQDAVIATFKSSKIINIQTNETVKKHNLDVRISHLFGNVGKESGGGIHTLYGFDQSEDIRIGFQYGVTDCFTIGVSRAKRLENLEGLLKYKLIEQSEYSSIPISATVFSNMTYSARSNALVEKSVYRFTYLAELIFARKFNSKFSVVIVPSFLHRNFVNYLDKNNTLSLGGGLRYKFTPSTSFIADYSHSFLSENLLVKNRDVLGAGIEIETGGHVFTIMFSNASGLLENDFLVNTYDSWTKGGYKISFIISRMFRLKKD